MTGRVGKVRRHTAGIVTDYHWRIRPWCFVGEEKLVWLRYSKRFRSMCSVVWTDELRLVNEMIHWR